MIQPVVITYFFGSEDVYARVLTEQTVTWGEGTTTERSPDYTLEFAGLTAAVQADFAAVYGQEDWLEPFLQRHGLTLGSGAVC